ncbi:MAG: ATP-binding protein [Desulfuromonadaceae bacterium]
MAPQAVSWQRFIYLRRSLTAALLFLLFSLLWGGVATAEDITLKVGVYQNPPKVFIDDTGEAAGIFVDIIEAVAAREGWEIEYVSGSWNRGLQRLRSGIIDLMPDVAHTPSRAGWFSYGEEPVLSDWFQVYVPAHSEISSMVDLNHKRVAVLEASVQKEAFEHLLQSFDFSIEIVPLPDYSTIFSRVENGGLDAAITNRFHGVTFATQFNLRETAVMFHPTRLFFAAPPKENESVLAAIDTHLRRLKQDPSSVYHDSLRRWTSEQIKYEFPSWVKGAAVLGLIVAGFAILGNIVLKKQVNVRTRELNKANEHMERRIEERTAELEAAMEKAQSADQVKSAFMASMSHELRTPLNSIIGFTGILLQELPGPLNGEQRNQMHLVQKSSRHLLTLINDVLDISKIEAGQLELSPTTFEVRTSIEKMLAIIEPLATEKDLTLQCRIAPEVGLISTDQRRLEQILLNLLSNAVKFTDSGQVGVDCYCVEDGYVVEVNDSGIGIAEEHIPELFCAFYQVDSGLARRHEGTGLGLYICKKLVDMMGGSIQVESRSGIGTTFRIQLPHRMG